MLWLLACSPAFTDKEGGAVGISDSGPTPESPSPPGPAPEGEGAESLGEVPSLFVSDTIWQMEIELTESAIADLALAPTDYVQGAFVLNGARFDPVGVRLKGNSTYQWLDGRPAFKIKADEYVDGMRIHGLERITLNSNYWDGSMMSETFAYGLWRRMGAPAPRTGYASVSFNGELYGLYTLVEAMDDDFIDATWPGSEGGLYEMCRTCDLTLDCSAYPLQETGDAYDPEGLGRACAAAASRDEAAIRAHFDWTALTRFFALERGLNHPDSYSFNQNNYYLYHDPLTDQVSLTPWGADSTFSYTYPPDEDRPCLPGRFDDLNAYPVGDLSEWCEGNAACWADVKMEMLRLAALLEDDDVASEVLATAAHIEAAVAEDPRWPWGLSTWESKVDCLHAWMLDRPGAIRGFVDRR
jgi:hypothetical protein